MKDNSQTTPDASAGATRWLGVVPALTAGGVGFLYGTGAVVKAAQLQGADLTLRDTLTLVPVEQLLVQGIATASTPLAGAVLLLLAGTLALIALTPEREPKDRKELRGWRLGVVLGALVSVVAAGVWVRPLTVAAAVLSILVGITPVLIRIRRTGDRSVGLMQIALTLTTAVATLSIFQAFVDPPPLARVALRLDSGDLRRGDLIVQGRGSWYYRDDRDRPRAPEEGSGQRQDAA